MGIGSTVERIRKRVMVEIFDLEPVAEPAPPRANWTTAAATSSGSAEAKDGETRLRILSLNAWGLPVAPKCTERAIEIANAIAVEHQYEIVVLQEIWHRRERDIIITRAQQAGFHYYHYFQAAVGFPVPLGADSFGTGLLVLSKFPITYAMFHSFSLSGRPYALQEADFVANKGVGLLRIQTPPGSGSGEVDLYVTHLLANYNHLGQPGPGDRYLAHRVGQSYELERFIEATTRSELTLVCGDFNSPPDCMVLRIPRELRQLRDAFTDMNNHDGLTFAAEDNAFSHGEHPMRMDYVLYKIASQQTTNSSSSNWQLVASDVYKGYFTDADGDKYPLSDHFGVTAEFVWSSRRHTNALKPCQQALGERSKEKASPVARAAHASLPRMCATTTCVHCDAVTTATTTSATLTQGPAKATATCSIAAKCLEEVQRVLYQGRADAASRRAEHLRRSAVSLFLAVALLAVRLLAFHMSNWVWLGVVLLFVHCVLEYVLAFFLVTLECSTFTELATEARLHLHAEHARAAKL